MRVEYFSLYSPTVPVLLEVFWLDAAPLCLVRELHLKPPFCKRAELEVPLYPHILMTLGDLGSFEHIKKSRNAT